MEPLHQPETLVDLFFIEQGGGQITRQQTRASGGDRAVNGVEQAAVSGAGQGPVNLEAGPRRTINREKFACFASSGWMQIGHIALGHMLDIRNQTARRRQFGARKFAHAVEHRHPEMILQALFRSDVVEMILVPAGCLCDSWQQRGRTDDFRRRQPRQFGVQCIVRNRRQFKTAGRYIRCRQSDLALYLSERDQHIVAARIEESILG